MAINLFEGEEIILEKRRHWFPITLQAVGFVIIGLLPFLVLFLQVLMPPEMRSIIEDYRFVYLFFSVAWLQVIWTAFFVIWTNYYLDIFLLTNKRIIDTELIAFFNRDIAETNLDNIQDVRVQVSGFFSTLLKYGDLYIQTAGEKREFLIQAIPDPYGALDTILKYKNKAGVAQL